jgi:hypothetical protein
MQSLGVGVLPNGYRQYSGVKYYNSRHDVYLSWFMPGSLLLDC